MIDYRQLEGGPIQLKPLSHHRKIVEFREKALHNFLLSIGLAERDIAREDVDRMMEGNLLNWIAWQQISQLENLFELYDSAPWFDKFQHLYFLYRATTHSRAAAKASESEALKGFEQYTHRKWMEFVNTEVRSINPQVADVFEQSHREWWSFRIPAV